MSSANQVKLAVAAETTFGTQLLTAGKQAVRFNSESLSSTVNDEDAAEINEERNITDVVPLGATHGGDIVTTLSYENLDIFMESVFYNAWADFGATDDTGIAVDTSGNAQGISELEAEVGDWIYIGGTGATGDVGWYRVTTITSDHPTKVLPAPKTAIAKGKLSKSMARLKNGKSRKGFTLEKQFSSLGDTDSGGKAFHLYTGAIANTLTMEFRAGATVGATVGLTALAHEASAATKFTGTAKTAKTGKLYSPADTGQVGIFTGGTTHLGSKPIITAVTVSITNNIREGEELGSLDVGDLIAGSFSAEGTVEMYFRDSDLYDRFLNRQDQEMAWVVHEPNDKYKGYGFYMPRVRMRNARIQAGGNDSDLIAQFDYRALGSSGTSPYSLKICRGAVVE